MFLLDTQLLDSRVSGMIRGVTDPIFAADAPPLKVKLVLDPFTPSKVPNPGDIIFPTFDGYAALETDDAGSPVTQVIDSLSGRIGYLLNEPIGGFRWICGTTPVTPQTVVGVVITDDDDAILWNGLLDAPKTITFEGDFIELSALLGYLQANLFAPL